MENGCGNSIRQTRHTGQNREASTKEEASGFAASRDAFVRNVICNSAFRLLPTPIKIAITLALHANHRRVSIKRQAVRMAQHLADRRLLELRTDTTISALEELVQAGHIRILESGQNPLVVNGTKTASPNHRVIVSRSSATSHEYCHR